MLGIRKSSNSHIECENIGITNIEVEFEELKQNALSIINANTVIDYDEETTITFPKTVKPLKLVITYKNKKTANVAYQNNAYVSDDEEEITATTSNHVVTLVVGKEITKVETQLWETI